MTEQEFISKLWPQKCGDSLKIIRKSDKRTKNGKGEYLWECEFIKYSYRFCARKCHIIQGNLINPEIENKEFIGHIFPQYCGDSLKVIRKTNKKNSSNNILFECEFIKYPCKVFALKSSILSKYVPNPNFNKRDFYLKEIQRNFSKKPTLKELSKLWNLKEVSVGKRIRENNLEEYISYYYENGSELEKEIRNYCLELNKNFLLKSEWKILNGQEIDIYNPILKLGFEFNGNYWHCDTFKDKDYHLNKLKLANSKGIKLYFIWEDKWLNNQEQIKQWIKDVILNGYSYLFFNEVDKIGVFKEDLKYSSPVLVKRGDFYCYNCGYIIN